LATKLVLVVLTVVGLFMNVTLSAHATGYPVFRREVAPGVYVEVLPRAELLAGVLSQTSWVRERGPRGSGNTYYQALKSYFAPYRRHDAIKLAERLTRRGFTYDAPVAFIAGLAELPALTAPNRFDAQLVKRAGSEKALADFAKALANLASQSRFAEFLGSQSPLLDDIVRQTVSDWDLAGMVDWMQVFYGIRADEYHLVLVPAMFPGGGYGVSVRTAAGKLALYMFLRESGQTEGAPQFFTTGKTTQWLALHEWGHSFVNPALGRYPERVRSLRPLYDKVAPQMKKMAYGNVETFLNEQVLRAVVVLGVKDLLGDEAARARVQQEESIGFYLTQSTVGLLESYRQRRSEYATFEAFVPEILRSYEEYLNVVGAVHGQLPEGTHPDNERQL
jgi:hypothetical protein